MSRRTIGLIATLCLALSAVAAAPALGAIGFVRQWTVQGFAGGETGVAVDRAGSVIYVADPFSGPSGRILAYDPNGTLLRVLDRAHGVDVERPAGVAVDSAGNLYVFEGDRNRVLVLSPTGSPVRAIAPTGEDAFDDLAQGIALDAQDNLYVADTRASRIEVFNTGGGLVRKFPLGGNFVDDVAVDAAGNVYALLIFGDGGCLAAVQKHDPNGTLITRWDVTQGADYSCARFGIAVDPRTGEVLVASQGGTKPGIRRYTPNGALVGAPLLGNGTPGDRLQAVGLAVDSAGTIYTRDTRTPRILRFGDLPPAPNLQNTIPSPQTITRGPATVVAPGKISLRSLKNSKCVRTLVVSTKPARVNVRIFSGIRSIRLFGQKVVVFQRAGKRVACIPVPFRARTFDARTRLRIAVGVALNAVEGKGGPAPRTGPPVTRPINLIP
jgi:DNA-binding beta-propeller fold protein YncE